MFLVLTMIILVAALNIISGLIMLVKDKGHDIAILRTMGATRGAIQRVFFMTGAAIGVVGHAGWPAAWHCSSASTSNTSGNSSSGFPASIPSTRKSITWPNLPADMDPVQNFWIVVMSLGPVLHCNALSLVAGRQARSGRSAEV